MESKEAAGRHWTDAEPAAARPSQKSPDVPSEKCPSPRAAAVTGRAEVGPQFMPHVVRRPGLGICRKTRASELVLATRSWPCSWGAEDKQREELETPPGSQGATPDPGWERLPCDCHSPLQALLCLPGQATEQLPPSTHLPGPRTSSSSSCPAS